MVQVLVVPYQPVASHEKLAAYLGESAQATCRLRSTMQSVFSSTSHLVVGPAVEMITTALKTNGTSPVCVTPTSTAQRAGLRWHTRKRVEQQPHIAVPRAAVHPPESALGH